MSLVPSLLQAIVQLDGDALVMHAGDKPYVVTPTGQVDLASRGLTLDAVNGIVSQLLPPEVLHALDEFGAAQYQLPPRADFPNEQFTVVAARGGDDIWMEIRRRSVPDDDRIPDDIFGPAAPAVVALEYELVGAGSVVAAVGHFGDPPPRHQETHGSATLLMSGHAGADDDALVLPDAAQLWGTGEPGEIPSAPPVYRDWTGATAAMPPALVPAPALPGLQLPDAAELWGTDVTATPLNEPVEQPAPPRVAAYVQSLASPAARAEPTPPPPASALPDAVGPPAPAPSPRAVWSDAPQLWGSSELAAPVSDAIDAPPPLVAPVHVHEPAAAPAFAPTPVAASLPAAIWRDAAQLWRSSDMAEQVIELNAATAAASVGPAGSVAPVDPVEDLEYGEHADPSEPVQDETPQTVAPPVHAAAVTPGTPPPAVVVPIARTLLRSHRHVPRADVTPSDLDRLLRLAAARGASTLYVSSDARPWMRVDGELQAFDREPILAAADVESLLLTMMPERSHEALRSGVPTEWLCEFEDVGRVRCVSFLDQRGPGGMFRLMASRAASMDQLALWREIQALVIEPEGLVLVAGPRSSGKRTLMAAFVDQINRTRRDHVISIETEINLIHERGKSFVSQREVRGSNEDVLAAARAALREDPDVLVIEDLRTGALMNVALEAAASGHLVIGGFSAHSATEVIDRIVDFYAPENRPQIQSALAEQLRGVVVQVLLRNNGGGRLSARELLLNTPEVARIIAEGKTSQLPMAIEAGRRHGMVTLNDSLAGFVQSGAVEASEAYRRSADRTGFLSLLKRRGIDASFIERLAQA